ncbi:response regulator [Microvirga massiliensis]|uniref:response regulator n=1 Tax=Microvirga massiliensis TaxID=1033741 RepID=UPI000A7AB9F3|nr:response regulator [Microvirga massiliensis]
MRRHRDTRTVLTAAWGGVALAGLLLILLIATGAPGPVLVGLGLLLVIGAGAAFLWQRRLLTVERAGFGQIAESVQALAWIVGQDGRIIHANSRASAFTGPAPAGDAILQSLVDPADSRFRGALPRLLGEGRPLSLEAGLRHRDGSIQPFVFTGTPLSSSGDGRIDAVLITALEPAAPVAEAEPGIEATTLSEEPAPDEAAPLPADDRLRWSQKFDALTRLTGGLAHDLNNRLMVITASIDSVAKHIKDRPDLRRRLVSALVAADQAEALISKLLAFARQHESQAQYIDTAEQLGSIATLLERSFPGHSAELVMTVDEDLWPVKVDPDRLETAIVNLAVNARETMREGGTVHLDAHNAVIRRGSLSDPELSGEFVEIRVSQSPAGRAADIQSEPEQAAVIAGAPGMQLIQDFARQHGGIVEITSREGEGASVSLVLPRSDLPARIGGKPRAEDLVEDEEETEPAAEVLVVDDEEEVALAMQGLLERAGYATRVAIGADRAIESIAARRPAVVLTDVTMSGKLDGIALAHLIRDRDPTLPVVLITGNPMVHARECPFPVLHKPISSRDLHAALQRQLQPSEDQKVLPFSRRPA